MRGRRHEPDHQQEQGHHRRAGVPAPPAEGTHVARGGPAAGRAGREQSWTFEEFLPACLQREVSARESHGGEGRIRAARFPARKSTEEFDFDHACGLKRAIARQIYRHLESQAAVERELSLAA